MGGVERPGVQTVGVQRRVLAVELLGDDDLPPAQPGQVRDPQVVRLGGTAAPAVVLLLPAAIALCVGTARWAAGTERASARD